MKVLRIDNQGVLEGRVYETLEDLRYQLCDFHSVDWQVELDENDEEYIDIYSLTLEEIMYHGDWSYQMITDEEANEPHYIRMYDYEERINEWN